MQYIFRKDSTGTNRPLSMSENDYLAVIGKSKRGAYYLFAGACVFFSVMLYLFCVNSLDLKTWLASVIITAYISFLGWSRLNTISTGRYLIVEGLCTEIMRSGFRSKNNTYSFSVVSEDTQENEINAFDLKMPQWYGFNKNLSYYFLFSTDKNGLTDYTKSSLITNIRKTPTIKRK